jgi:acetylornithine deacetylase/succinyl-diaminopimelate desuccinylase-like protein
VIPSKTEFGMDIRIPPTINLEKFETFYKKLAGEFNITYEFKSYSNVNPYTDYNNNYFCKILKNTLENLFYFFFKFF